MSNLSGSNLNSSVLYLAGHGSADSIIWPYRNSSSTYGLTTSIRPSRGYVSVSNQSFSNTKVAILAACNAGKPYGLAYKINEKGADIAFGWTETVEYVPMRHFGYLLTEYLANGKRFIDALSYVYADMAAGNTESGFGWDTINQFNPSVNPPYYKTATYGNFNTRITDFRSGGAIDEFTTYTKPA